MTPEERRSFFWVSLLIIGLLFSVIFDYNNDNKKSATNFLFCQKKENSLPTLPDRDMGQNGSHNPKVPPFHGKYEYVQLGGGEDVNVEEEREPVDYCERTVFATIGGNIGAGNRSRTRSE